MFLHGPPKKIAFYPAQQSLCPPLFTSLILSGEGTPWDRLSDSRFAFISCALGGVCWPIHALPRKGFQSQSLPITEAVRFSTSCSALPVRRENKSPPQFSPPVENCMVVECNMRHTAVRSNFQKSQRAIMPLSRLCLNNDINGLEREDKSREDRTFSAPTVFLSTEAYTDTSGEPWSAN